MESVVCLGILGNAIQVTTTRMILALLANRRERCDRVVLLLESHETNSQGSLRPQGLRIGPFARNSPQTKSIKVNECAPGR
jgi:hypothetical protein